MPTENGRTGSDVQTLAHATEGDTIALLELDQVDPSPLNPWKDTGDVTELAESIKAHGVLQPVSVRLVKGRWELVFGHRRFAAAKKAKLEKLPAIVLELSDKDVVEKQTVENVQRRDSEPLAEGEAYRMLNEQFGQSVDEIAEKTGKSRRSIYARMQLGKLIPEAKAKLRAGELALTVATIVARVVDPEKQKKTLDEVLGGEYGDAPMGAREAAHYVENEQMINLVRAPFSVADEDLVREAGSCNACPKRTGSNAELYAGVKNAKLCTDAACYRGKCDAAWKAAAWKAKQNGQDVLPDKKAETMFREGELPLGSSYVDLDSKKFDDKKGRTWRQILGAWLKEPTQVYAVEIARDSRGGIHELVAKAHLPKEHKPKAASNSGARGGGYDYAAQQKRYEAQQQKEKEAKAFREKVIENVLPTIFAMAPRISEEDFWKVLWPGIANDLVDSKAACAAWKVKNLSAPPALSCRDLRAFLFACMAENYGNGWSDYGRDFRFAAKLSHVDMNRVEKALKQVDKEREKLAKTEPKKVAQPKKKGRK